VDTGVRAVPAAPLTTFGDGRWAVGRDVAPGTYAATGSTATCHHVRLPRAGAAADGAQGTVVLADGWFETAGCGRWTRVG
jgi:hypothetical protein